MSGSGEPDPHRSSLGRPSDPEDIVRRPHPLRERSQSQNNTLAIRVVPYTPPRLDAQGRSASQSSANPHAAEARSFSGNDVEQGVGRVRASWARRASDMTERPSGSQASAWSSPSSSTTSLTRSWEGVGGVSASKPATGLAPQPAPGPRPRSNFSNNTSINAAAAATVQSDDDQDGQPSPASSTASAQKHISRRQKFIAVHADKTFSLVPLRPISATRNSLQSPPLSFTTTVRTSSSHERLSSDAFSDDRPSSPGTTATFADLSLSPFTPSPNSSTTQLAEDPIAASPGNDRMVGGLRKVPKTPDFKQKKSIAYTAAAQETPLAPLPEASSPEEPEDFEHTTLAEQGDSSPAPAPEATPPRLVIPKDSFTSEESVSTLSETTNYKVYEYSPSIAADSTDSIRPPSSNDSNVQLLGESSPAAPVFESSPISLRTPASDQNYVLHGDPSPTPSFATVSRQPRATYSQESLLVPPLRTARRRSPDKYGYYKSRSRESLRRTESAKSLQSISSIVSQEASQPLFAAPALINFRAPSTPNTSANPDRSDAWDSTPPAQTTGSIAPAEPQRRVQMIESHPHQWSSQLSTVMSEDEEDSPRSRSRSARSVSPLSATPSGSGSGNGHRRRSSTGWASSTHSRQMLSISSSLAAQLEETESLTRSHSRSDSLDRPQPAYLRGQSGGGAGGSPRMVRDQDEYGDGLADLQELSQHPSRTGLSAFFASTNSSSRNLHSSSSSRANSLSSVSGGSNIPAWARLYYGSGEQRRLIGAPSISEESEGDGSSGPFGPAPRRVGSFRAGSDSPGTDHFPLNIYSKRKRAKQAVVGGGGGPFSDSASIDVPQGADYESKIRPGLRQKTSSIWSPHLRFDRRASRYSIWEPPSVSWSAESGLMGRRNAQVVLFMVGFVFPFAWMIAAFLPLPPKSQAQQMLERAQGEFGVPEAFKQQLLTADEVRYQSARWWRNLNRCMAVLGLLLLGAVVALVVVGVRQGWGR